jgi:hypothetical protein
MSQTQPEKCHALLLQTEVKFFKTERKILWGNWLLLFSAYAHERYRIAKNKFHATVKK